LRDVNYHQLHACDWAELVAWRGSSRIPDHDDLIAISRGWRLCLLSSEQINWQDKFLSCFIKEFQRNFEKENACLFLAHRQLARTELGKEKTSIES
jgi:hypothetical protein